MNLYGGLVAEKQRGSKERVTEPFMYSVDGLGSVAVEKRLERLVGALAAYCDRIDTASGWGGGVAFDIRLIVKDNT